MAIQIRAQGKRKVLNSTRFYSGSKKFHCLNLQGVCDADTLFTTFTCKHVGSTNDSDAFANSSLETLNSALPFPYHWVGDAAYTCTETCMIPYSGVNLHLIHPEQDCFNFYQSQIRITIERTFGIFIMRWGIFWNPLKYDLDFILVIVHACVRLHNFCCKRNLPIIQTAHTQPSNVSVDENGRLLDEICRIPKQGRKDTHKTSNTLRDEILNEITENNYQHVRSHHK